MPSPITTLEIRASFSISLFYAAIVTDVISIATGLSQHSFWQNITPEQLVQLQDNPTEGIPRGNALISLISIVVSIVTAVTFLRWFHQAYRNLLTIGVEGLKYSPGWTIFGFIIPIVSLFIPFQIAKEIWQGSFTKHPSQPDDWKKQTTPITIKAWWGFFVCASLTAFMSAQVMARTQSVTHIVQAIEGIIISNFMSILSAWFAIQMIKTITQLQRQALDKNQHMQLSA
ncbi:MAG: DUF4328 domain-containing protein [Methylococcales bacterium]|jgi:hypothetical protein|nr:DUF4328 domain-containing protein [Methylococcales bacterium]MBT7442508.1 DUF4328 domain-containing protein [Methylococcales bacterium]